MKLTWYGSILGTMTGSRLSHSVTIWAVLLTGVLLPSSLTRVYSWVTSSQAVAIRAVVTSFTVSVPASSRIGLPKYSSWPSSLVFCFSPLTLSSVFTAVIGYGRDRTYSVGPAGRLSPVTV
ncbi:hypothetical protein D3C86_1619850 [compost metagenome]